jgi:hypothetical protein
MRGRALYPVRRATPRGRLLTRLIPALLLATGAAVFLFVTQPTVRAQEPTIGPDVAHALDEHDICLACHGSDGIRQAPADHAGMTNEQCTLCHSPSPPPEGPPQEPPAGDSYCLTCHENANMAVQLEGGQSLSLYVDATAIRDSVHKGIGCTSCHDEKGAYPHPSLGFRSFAAYRAELATLCGKCHATVFSIYAESVHGQKVLAETGRGAACSDCHSNERSGHSIWPVLGRTAPIYPARQMDTCGRCHPEERETYLETSHSKVVRYGDPQGAATCTSCHGYHDAHRVHGPTDELTSKVLAEEVCSNCHDGAHASFAAGWMGHRGATATRFPLVYFTERFFVFLTAVVAGVGIVHVELEIFRWLIDRRRRHREKG